MTPQPKFRPRPLIVALSMGFLLAAAAPLRAETPPLPRHLDPEKIAEDKGWVPGDAPPVSPGPRINETRITNSPGLRRLRPRPFFLPGQGQKQGALSGKTVYLSPGHGWVYKTSPGWYSQRGNTHGVVEDMSNADGITQFLLPYLWAAGAQVMPVRELDQQREMVILDNDDGNNAAGRGDYEESGDATLYQNSTLPGWGHPTLPLTGTENPFSLGSNRLLRCAPTETARATFTLDVPRSGYYFVYVSYSMYTARPSDARYIVVHPGGETTYLVDQRRHGSTWVLLGRHWFDKGKDKNRGAIVVSNQSADAGSFVSIDAVRIGGGMGLINRGGGLSGEPRADECARYNAQFCGAPASVYNNSTNHDGTDDVSTRSLMADWLHAAGEDSVFLSHHTNAFNGNTRGTETYIYGSNPPNGSYNPDSRVIALGADKLAKAVHDEVIKDIRAVFEPGWKDRKVKSAYFGEINPNRQDEMPAALIELAFHDNATDAAMLRDPHFRRVTARAMYKGIVRYFAAKDGSPVTFIPEPPAGLAARNSGDGEITVSWKAPPTGGVLGGAATSYRVYTSRHGFAFDEGVDTAGKTSITLNNRQAGEVLFIRVVATNEGGESLPSPTVAVGVANPGQPTTLLLVGGYDRFDEQLNVLSDYSKFTQVHRLFVDQMNDGTLLAHYGRALQGKKLAFDGAWHDALGGELKLVNYRSVLWSAGKGISADRGLSDAAVAALGAAAAQGTGIIVSGSNVARGLAASGEADAKTLLETHLTSAVTGSSEEKKEIVPGGPPAPLGGLPNLPLAAPGWRPFGAGELDVLDATSPGNVIASFAGGGGAGVLNKGEGRCAMLLSFPLASIADDDRRAQAIATAARVCPLDGGAQSDGPVGGDGSGPQDAGPDGPAQGDDSCGGEDCDCGCGCHVSTPGGGEGLSLLLLLALLAWRRRARPGK